MTSNANDFLKAGKSSAGNLLTVTVALGVTGGLFVIMQAWLLAQVVNAVIFDAAELTDIMQWMWWLLAVIMLRAAISYITERTAFIASTNIKQDIREQLNHHVQRLGPLHSGNRTSGEIATVISDAVEALESYYARYLPAMSLAAMVPLSILVFIIPSDWQSAAIFIVTAPLIPLFMIFIGRGAEKLNQQQWQKLTRMSGYLLDVIQGLATLKLFQASKREAGVIERVSEDYRRSTMKVLRMAFLSSMALEFLATVSIALVAVTIGFRLLYGQVDFQSAFFVLLLAPEFYLPLRSMGTHYHARMDAVAASDKILDLLDTPLPDHAIESKQLTGVLFPLRFDAVRVYYGDRQALDHIDFEIRHGERLAIVGPTGAGKSTLVNLLLGFVSPDSGSLLINNRRLEQYDIVDWRQRITWVPQRPTLFHASIAGNITLGLRDIDNEQIWQALDMARAADFVRQLPEGIDTLVGEGGQQLSGGQVQRLSLARALLRILVCDAELLILDEPTAHLDRDNQKLIQQAIAELPDDITIITVAHHLTTVRDADRIIVLDRGCVAQQGNHAMLTREPGIYRQLIEAGELQESWSRV